MQEYVSKRITSLRKQKGVSEYRMSYDLGRSRGYVNSISSGKAMPSMAEFFAICEYFDITPQEFFNDHRPQPELQQKVCQEMERMDVEDQRRVLDMAERLSRSR